jgi:hypothetical protein
VRRNLAIFIGTLLVLAIGGYSAGLFTSDSAERESCALCRANRFSGLRYGFPYARIEETEMSGWYREAFDPDHGKSGHDHVFMPSACPVYAAPGVANLDAACPSISPIFLLKPETELAVLQAAPDNRTRRAIIDGLNTSNRKLALERVKLVVEYAYIYKGSISWTAWWQRNSGSFGARAPRPIARR